MKNDLVTCTGCGWVHFKVTRAKAEAEVKRFNEYYDDLTPEEQERYYGSRRSSIKNYEGCMVCRGTSFREAKEGDSPEGCTLNPVIVEEGA